jgi:hypothetical protein
MNITLDNIYVDSVVSLGPVAGTINASQYRVQVYPDLIGYGISPPLNTIFLKEVIQEPLEKWCSSSFASTYSINFRYNDGDPFWSLILQSEEDLSLFLLRFGHLNKS